MNPFKSETSENKYKYNYKYKDNLDDARFFKNKKQLIYPEPTKQANAFKIQQNDFPSLENHATLSDNNRHAPTTQCEGLSSSHAPTAQCEGLSSRHAPTAQCEGLSSRHAPTTQCEGLSSRHAPTTQCEGLDIHISFAEMMKESMKEENNSSLVEDPVDPGWVSIKRNKDTQKIEYKWGPKTDYLIQSERNQKIKDDLSYSMYKAIGKIQDLHIRYEDLYDQTYGDGAYNYLYRYGIQYDSASDEESDIDDSTYDNYDNSTEY